jgi:WD40 repeat protein
MPSRERRLRRQAGETDPIQALAIDPSGTFVFSVAERSIKVFRWEARELVAELPYESTRLDRLIVTPEGWVLAIAGDGIQGWNLGTGVKRSFPGPSGHIHQCVSPPDGAGRLLTSLGSTCTIWDLSTLEPLRVLSHDKASVRAATLSKSGDRVVSIDDNGVLHVWDARMGARLSKWPREAYCDRALPLLGAKIDSEGRWVLSTTLADMYLWDVERGAHRWHVEGPSPDLSFFFPSGDGRTAAMRTHGGRLEIWNLVDGCPLMSFSARCAPDAVAAFSPDGRTLIVCDGDGFTFQVIDVETRARVESTQRHTSRIKRLVVHPDGQTLFTAGEEEPVVAWDVKTGSPTGRLGDSPARGALEGDDVDPMERLLDEFMVRLERMYTGYRSAARAGDGDGDEYRDEARWIEKYWDEVQAFDVSPGAGREEVLERLDALVAEVRGNGVWMGPREVKEMIARCREHA